MANQILKDCFEMGLPRCGGAGHEGDKSSLVPVPEVGDFFQCGLFAFV